MSNKPRPWGGIEVPSNGVAARRADPRHALDFFWIRDESGRIGLMLRLPDGPLSLPAKVDLAGIDVEFRRDIGLSSATLYLLLQDPVDSDLFAALGSDLLASTATVTDASLGLAAVMRRLRRWQELLSRPRASRMTVAELEGLFGELTILDRVLVPRLGPNASVEAWQGPLGMPQDFCVGSTAVEVKTLLGTARREVRISSADQLETKLANLRLAVVTVSIAGDTTGTCVPDLVIAIRSRLTPAGANVVEAFNDRLVALGYVDLDVYHEHRFSVERVDWFAVAGTFPRIRAGDLAVGLSKVSYTLSLTACEPHRVGVPLEEDL